eukprot:1437500-Rhodomonas_salina.5
MTWHGRAWGLPHENGTWRFEVCTCVAQRSHALICAAHTCLHVPLLVCYVPPSSNIHLYLHLQFSLSRVFAITPCKREYCEDAAHTRAAGTTHPLNAPDAGMSGTAHSLPSASSGMQDHHHHLSSGPHHPLPSSCGLHDDHLLAAAHRLSRPSAGAHDHHLSSGRPSAHSSSMEHGKSELLRRIPISSLQQQQQDQDDDDAWASRNEDARADADAKEEKEGWKLPQQRVLKREEQDANANVMLMDRRAFVDFIVGCAAAPSLTTQLSSNSSNTIIINTNNNTSNKTSTINDKTNTNNNTNDDNSIINNSNNNSNTLTQLPEQAQRKSSRMWFESTRAWRAFGRDAPAVCGVKKVVLCAFVVFCLPARMLAAAMLGALVGSVCVCVYGGGGGGWVAEGMPWM